MRRVLMMMALLSGSAFAWDPRSPEQTLSAFTQRDFCEANEYLNGQRFRHVPFASTTLPNLLRDADFILNAKECALNITASVDQDYHDDVRRSEVSVRLTVSLVEPAVVQVRGEAVEIHNAPLLVIVKSSVQVIPPDDEAVPEAILGQIAQLLEDAFGDFQAVWAQRH